MDLARVNARGLMLIPPRSLCWLCGFAAVSWFEFLAKAHMATSVFAV